MKQDRLLKILDIISNSVVETQEDLITRLSECGYEVTQATVSRDIKELKLIKVSGSDGVYRYAAPSAGEKKSNAKYINILHETLVAAQTAGNLAVLKTYPGMAQAAAAAVDALSAADIVGSIAGDDTIFVAFHSLDAAAVFVANMHQSVIK